MGSSFFKKQAMPNFSQGGTNLEARAMGANTFGSRAAASASGKDLAAALAINKAGAYKKSQRTSAYAPGPKKV